MSTDPTTRDAVFDVVVVGAGFGGLAMGVALRRAGVRNFVLLEKSTALGGTWRDNDYPGAACDVLSHLYSYSFELNPDWTRRYAPQAEIRGYLERTADTYDVRPNIRFGTELKRAVFDDATATWRVETSDGTTLETKVLVTATGQLNRPHVPKLPGLESFRGEVFHSARWNPSLELRGRKVAVIGSGASAIQIIPRVAELAERLVVHQRTPAWIIPRGDREYSQTERWVLRNVPGAARALRAWIYGLHEARFAGLRKDSLASRFAEWQARRHLESQVSDAALRAKLTPTEPIGCKRILLSDDYYPALTRPNVELVTEAIDCFEPDAIVTHDGRRRTVDTVVLCTGFESTSFLAPMQVVGANGHDLREAWRDGAEAYLGMCVAGFPNFFMLYGPNTNLGHNSIIFMLECQVRYVLLALDAMRENELSQIGVRPDVMRSYNRSLQQELATTTWSHDCQSWYKTPSGKITNNWSSYATRYWWMTRRLHLNDFACEKARDSMRA